MAQALAADGSHYGGGLECRALRLRRDTIFGHPWLDQGAQAACEAPLVETGRMTNSLNQALRYPHRRQNAVNSSLPTFGQTRRPTLGGKPTVRLVRNTP